MFNRCAKTAKNFIFQDIREYDVPYHVRVCIDLEIFVAKWYTVSWFGQHDTPEFVTRNDLLTWPEPVVLVRVNKLILTIFEILFLLKSHFITSKSL